MSTLVLALVAGAVVGLALGALGGGGSMLAVPALIYLLGFTPADATTASLLIVAVTSATALYAHARSGQVRWRAGALFAAAGILPAAGAGAVASRLPQAALTAAFAGVAGVAGVLMLRVGRTGSGGGVGRGVGVEREGGPGRAGRAEGSECGCGVVREGGPGHGRGPECESGSVREGGSGGEVGPERGGGSECGGGAAPGGGERRAGTGGGRRVRARAGAVRKGRAAGAGAGLGALTGLLGVGGGFLVVPALVTVLAFEMRAATGTSLLVIAVNSLASLVTRGSTTTGLDWAVVAPFTGAAVLGAWDGKRLAARLTGAALRRTFAIVLLTVAAAMGVDAVVQSGGWG